MAEIDEIDWSKCEGAALPTVYCRCGAEHLSYAMPVRVDGRFRSVSEHPCPECGSREDIRRVSWPRESFRVRADETGGAS